MAEKEVKLGVANGENPTLEDEKKKVKRKGNFRYQKPRDTLCWNCKRAATDKEHQCSWVRRFEPVEGWEAEKNIIKNGDITTESYLVKSCPYFKKRDKFSGKYTNVLIFLCKYHNKSLPTIQNNFDKYADLYEQETGKKLPTWVRWVERDKEYFKHGLPDDFDKQEWADEWASLLR